MKYLLVFLLAALCVPSFGQTVINDKNVEVRSIGTFSGIKVSGGIDVYLSQGNEYAVAVSAAEDKFRDEIKTEVKNGVLNIYYDAGTFRYNGNRNLRAYVSFKTLESIEASGACDLNINENLNASTLKIKLSGACDVEGKVTIRDMQINMSGASTVKLSGAVQNLKIDASGASDIKNYSLTADNCVADVSGASDIKITVNKSISAKASGASNVYYKGNPDRKDINTSGASNVAQRN